MKSIILYNKEKNEGEISKPDFNGIESYIYGVKFTETSYRVKDKIVVFVDHISSSSVLEIEEIIKSLHTFDMEFISVTDFISQYKEYKSEDEFLKPNEFINKEDGKTLKDYLGDEDIQEKKVLNLQNVFNKITAYSIANDKGWSYPNVTKAITQAFNEEGDVYENTLKILLK